MIDVYRASRVQDKDFRLSGGDAGATAERLKLIEALRHGNIYEVFAKSPHFKISDFTDFFANQWKGFKGQIVQDQEIKAMEGMYHEPAIEQFSIHHKGTVLSPEERQLYWQEMSKFVGAGAGGAGGGGGATPYGGKLKAQGVGKGEAAATSTEDGTGTAEGTAEASSGPMTGEEVQSATQGTLDEWNQFLSDSWGSIFDAQMKADYEKRMGEIKGEVQKILSMVKSGQIEPEFALVALAKVNSTKNGCLMTWLGKKSFHVNETMNNIYNELKTMSPTDPNYYSTLQTAQSTTRDGQF
ncbi:MAG: hypothetical protein WC956_06170, partial [bacterium]